MTTSCKPIMIELIRLLFDSCTRGHKITSAEINISEIENNIELFSYHRVDIILQYLFQETSQVSNTIPHIAEKKQRVESDNKKCIDESKSIISEFCVHGITFKKSTRSS